MHIGATQLSLKSGKYLVGSIKTIGFAKVKISGAVSLYVDGSIEQIGAEVFDLDDAVGADLFSDDGDDVDSRSTRCQVRANFRIKSRPELPILDQLLFV